MAQGHYSPTLLGANRQQLPQAAYMPDACQSPKMVGERYSTLSLSPNVFRFSDACQSPMLNGECYSTLSSSPNAFRFPGKQVLPGTGFTALRSPTVGQNGEGGGASPRFPSMGAPASIITDVLDIATAPNQAGAPSRRFRRSHTLALVPAEGLHIGQSHVEPTPDTQSQPRLTARTRTWTTGCAAFSNPAAVSVIAPGGGTGCNGSVYNALGAQEGFRVEIKGQSRAPYDRYPASWSGQGAPAPNLETFAHDLLSQGLVEKSDCLVFGSRGGQVVLPTLWQVHGAEVPPAVVINGGCAMGEKIPQQVQWPEKAVTFLMIGGRDYFRGQLNADDYLADTLRHVPLANSTTAILLVNDMAHMPQSNLLGASLQHMLSAAMAWKGNGRPPMDNFNALLKALAQTGWSGRLLYKVGPGGREAWEGAAFSSQGVMPWQRMAR